MQKKHQVFISSTFSDLKLERQAAVEATLAAGHIPAGMELFAAGDESQIEVIERWIDDSDIYMLILGGRYGSINPSTGISYTEHEYDYAISKNKPFFALVLSDHAIQAKLEELGANYRDKKTQKNIISSAIKCYLKFQKLLMTARILKLEFLSL
jgi:hypothetical protein